MGTVAQVTCSLGNFLTASEGFCHFEATLANTLLGASPTEKVKPQCGVQLLFETLRHGQVRQAPEPTSARQIRKTLVNAVFLHLWRIATHDGEEAFRQYTIRFIV
jgi:hypothetical protein